MGRMPIILLVVSILFTLVSGTFLAVKGYQLVRDIDALIDRAQVAADREDMLEYMNQLKVNMENNGMTKGHTALIFKTPENDMALNYKTVTRIIERLESIKDIPKKETTYQVALNDLRGIIREFHNPALNWLWIKYVWWILAIGVVLWLLYGLSYYSENF